MANLLQRLVGAFRNESVVRGAEPTFEEKASAAGAAIVATSVGTAVWPPRDYSHFALDGYVKNAIAFRCIQMISQSGAYAPLVVFDKKTKKQIDDSPIIDLLASPAPQTTGVELLERVYTFLKIAGNSYMEQVGPSRADAPPKELYSLRPDRMKVIAGVGGVPQSYEYEANGRKAVFPVDRITGKSPILHLKLFNPLDDWYGMSSMEPAAYAIDRHNESGSHNMAVLQNGAVPSGALVFKPVTVDGASVNAPSDLISTAERKLEERHQGAKNSGRPFVFGGNVDWVTFGQTMEQLQLIDSKSDAARDICTTFGVPHILLIPGQSTYNNNREAKLALYEETVLPMVSWVVDHLNVWLVPQFGDNYELRIDYDSIDALSLRRDEKRKTYMDMFDKRLITRDEFREALAFEPLEEMPPFDSDSAEVNAVAALINGGKLSSETGFAQLAKWGVLPKDVDFADEAEKVTQENGGVDGNTGLNEEVDPVTGKPLPKPPVKKPPL